MMLTQYINYQKEEEKEEQENKEGVATDDEELGLTLRMRMTG